MIHFNCPTCQQALQIAAARAGHELGCPACGAGLMVPSPQLPEDGPRTRPPVGPPLPPVPPPVLARPAARPRPGLVSRRPLLVGLAGVAAACLVALLYAGRQPGADGLVLRIVCHPWWPSPPARADVEAIAREVGRAPPGAMVYIDDAGKPFRAVPHRTQVELAAAGAYGLPHMGQYMTAMLRLMHPDGRPLGQVRHCCVAIPRERSVLPPGEWELRLVLQALEEAAGESAGPPVFGSRETAAPEPGSWTLPAGPSSGAYRTPPQAPPPGL